MRDHVLSSIPYPVRILVGMLIYRQTTQNLHRQGTNRYTADEIRGFRQEIWENINELLIAARKTPAPEEPFWILGGARPTEADGTLFGFVTSILVCTA